MKSWAKLTDAATAIKRIQSMRNTTEQLKPVYYMSNIYSQFLTLPREPRGQIQQRAVANCRDLRGNCIRLLVAAHGLLFPE